jgi:peptide/nickel transport system ATP-binding protein
MIAVAVACDPPLVVADEPTTALDVTVQAEVLDLLDAFRRERSLGVLLITHDLGVVAGRADRVAVMYAGRIVEQGPVRAMFATPRHPYTQALLAAAPGRAPAWGQTPVGGQSQNGGQVPLEGWTPASSASPRRLPVIQGAVPSLASMPPGCAFEPRCAARLPRCRSGIPPSVAIDPAHEVACFLHPDPVHGGRRDAR